MLEDINIKGAKGILVNITCSSDLSISEFNETSELIKDFSSHDATVIVGTALNETMKDDMSITIVVSGIQDRQNKFHLIK